MMAIKKKFSAWLCLIIKQMSLLTPPTNPDLPPFQNNPCLWKHDKASLKPITENDSYYENFEERLTLLINNSKNEIGIIIKKKHKKEHNYR